MEYVKDKVSIVLLCYNNAPFLNEAIQSIMNQTYQNFEIIIADDASTDNSRDIIEKWASQDYRIISVIQPINLGISGNQNAGFSKVTGEFIVPMSGDDILLPKKLEKQVAYLKGHPECGLVLSKTVGYDSKTDKILFEYAPAKIPEGYLFNVNWPFGKSFKKYAGSHNNSTTMARSDYYLKNIYDIRLKFKGEVLHAIDNFAQKKYIKWQGLDENLVLYRQHEGSATKNSSLTKFISEENWIVYAIASSRYPELTKFLKNKRDYFLYTQIIYMYLNNKKIGSFLVQFYYEAGLFKLCYLLLKLLILCLKKN